MSTKPFFPVAIDSTTLKKPCKIWTKAVSNDGYGRTGHNKRPHRIAFFKAHGFLTKGLDVCHWCNNKLCYEETHLYEGTRAENMRQATQDGLTSKKLTPDQVREIRKLLKENTQYGLSKRDMIIAEMFNVSRFTISDIRLGKAWSNLDG